MTYKEEVAWAAGFYEGEGSIGFYTGRNVVWRISVDNTDRTCLERFLNCVKVGTVRSIRKRQAHHKQSYRWDTVRPDEIEKVVKVLWPHLSERRRDQILLSASRRSEFLAARVQLTCAGCGCDFDANTPGCENCRCRHRQRLVRVNVRR